jgi:hypothetical protein
MTSLKRNLLVVMPVLIATLFAGCGQTTPVALPISTETVQATAISTPELIASVTVSPQPTVQFAITANPDQLVRWREYEFALAKKLLSYLPPEEVLCEWEILGQSGQEVYVWAVCLGLPPAGRGEEYAPYAGIPAVIHLGSDGSVQSVELPRDNSSSYVEGIQNIFPKDVQERIFNRLINYVALTDHAEERREYPGPPLIVLLATPQP